MLLVSHNTRVLGAQASWDSVSSPYITGDLGLWLCRAGHHNASSSRIMGFMKCGVGLVTQQGQKQGHTKGDLRLVSAGWSSLLTSIGAIPWRAATIPN